MDWRNYQFWRKNIRRLEMRQQSLTYMFKEQSENLLLENDLSKVFSCSKGHPLLLKKYLGGEISLETLSILEKIFSFQKNFDKKLTDPVWETVSLKLKKYLPFININVFHFKNILRGIVNE